MGLLTADGLRAQAPPAAVVAAVAAPRPAGIATMPFVKGISWGWVGTRGDYAGPEAEDSMRRLAETGAEWVCIAFAANMETYNTPRFTWGAENAQMVTDDEIRRAIDLARANKLKVILKPVVNSNDGVWRAWIRFYRPVTADERAVGISGIRDPWGDQPTDLPGQTADTRAWETWWGCFSNFLDHYAEIAEEKQAEAFCLGCEMSSTEAFVERWRKAIASVRGIYHGPLTYDINHGRENALEFWDAVDFISVSGYYHVPPPEGQTETEAVLTTTPKEQVLAALAPVRDQLREVSARWGKPVLFIETGVTNVRGCARYPWSHPDAYPESPLDDREQVNYYEAMLETFWDEPWFAGFAWWDWPARLYPAEQAGSNRGFCIYGKRAEGVLKQWYAKPRGEAAAAQSAEATSGAPGDNP